MRIGAAIALLAALGTSMAACGGGGFLRQYEYEEDVYLSLDGSATVYVNGSVAAINALRGTAFDADLAGAADRAALSRYFESPVTRVARTPTLSRRRGRRFAHVRLAVDDLRRLSEAAPFAWSSYRFGREGDLFVFRQTLGAPSGGSVPDVTWTGDELVAFRLHLPSRIVYHNAGPGNPRRGNILVWEQPLADRLTGVPLAFEARMEVESILFRTLLLFGVTAIAVGLLFGVVVWWVARRPAKGGAR